MGTIAGSIVGAAGDVVATGIQTGAQIAANNKTNATNLQIAQETNKTNAANVAATNAANVAMNNATNQANLDINKATNAANVAIVDKTNAANLAINEATNASNYQIAQETNAANAQIAQMNNEYNERMLERQLQQEWEMWDAENEYNTPAAQMQRQREAGVNPYVAANAGSISSGNAGSMTNPSAQPASSYTAVGAQMQAAQMQAATLQPTSLTPGHVDAAQAQMVGVSAPDLSAMDGLRGIAGSFFDLENRRNEVQKGREEVKQIGIETKYKEMEILTRLAQANEEIKSKAAKRKLDEIASDFQADIYSSELAQRREETFLTQLKSGAQIVSNLSQLQWYNALPIQIKQTINEQAVRINNLKLQGRLTNEQIKTEVEKQFDVMAGRLIKEDQHQMNWETWNVQKRKAVADLVSTILNAGASTYGGLNGITWKTFGLPKQFNIDYWDN